jgi:hypothetical protein
VTYAWDKLAVDDHEGDELPGWDCTVGLQGQILKLDGEGDDNFRRMLSPMIFVYPEKPVVIGDKWTVDVKPGDKLPKFTYTYEAKSKEDVDGVNALVVTVKFKEDGDKPINGDGLWWVSKVGKVVKFSLKLSNWVVPMAGSEVTDVTIRGKAL